MELHFNKSKLTGLQSDDLMTFLSYILHQPRIEIAEHISVNSVSYAKPHESNPLMIYCHIVFQVWRKNESGNGKRYQWENHRAIDHSCGNISLTELPSEVEQAFDTAINSGILSNDKTKPNYVGNYMYMGNNNGKPAFKHIDTRKYLKY
jgi:hypothetical protein